VPFEALQVALEPSDRAVLHERIAERFRAMLAAGCWRKCEGLRRSHALDANLPSMRAVGYRQAWETLEGAAPESTLATRGIAATRQLAKRQLTWLRAMDGSRSATTACAPAWRGRGAAGGGVPQSSPWYLKLTLSFAR
jgi:tRNA dimethylallyltransferase